MGHFGGVDDPISQLAIRATIPEMARPPHKSEKRGEI